mmetsp:Transcript_34192/g.52461  ORF Transcript_34192/g.52461 Transcript_34192/m.52461 type:complete len:139 (+) Transcript_34192:228-644(+)
MELSSPDMLCVNLAYMLDWEQSHLQVRQVAGLSLKSQIEKHFAILRMSTIDYVKKQTMNVFSSTNSRLIKVVSHVMSMIVQRGGFNIWPELLGYLVNNLTKECFSEDATENELNMAVVENSIHTISLIVEDCQSLFED